MLKTQGFPPPFSLLPLLQGFPLLYAATWGEGHDISFGTLPLHDGFLISSCEMVWLCGGHETNLPKAENQQLDYCHQNKKLVPKFHLQHILLQLHAYTNYEFAPTMLPFILQVGEQCLHMNFH